MLKYFDTATRITLVTIVLFGLLYPLALTALAQAIFPNQADGSLVMRDGRAVGSSLIGQLWTKPLYFHGRPSAAGRNGYDPTATGGTNLGPSSKKLISATKATIAQLRHDNPDATLRIPMDLVTSSASGIDPDISPEAAYYQAPRVANARHLRVALVDGLIAKSIQPRTLGILGDPHINVLTLNLALDNLH